ncbi:YmfL family putative regulatory protein [Pantoea stewartii]|uniref:YmfL family putative regulatory protein n=1 Tax=Pantoea stewartii TaxID=66269 RepID=UPI00138FB030|nr:YmfL family putative regulatory protein [Pantoea stewartii]
MGHELQSKNVKQPEWLIRAIQKTITELDGGYAEAAQWLGVTENSLFNRLRVDGDQIFPIGWALILQRASKAHHIADALANDSGGVFVKLPVVEQMGNEELLHKFNDLLSALGRFASFHNESTSDGILNIEERKRMRAKGYKVQSLVAEIMVVTELLFGTVDARECAAPGVMAIKSTCMEH